VADDIRMLSAALAKDPSSLVYVELAELLRRAGRRDEALRVVMHGLGRHPQHADGYDCLGRIQADLGQAPQARWAWEKALQIAPEHGGALRGVAFLYYRDGDARRAADALEHALAVDPNDEAARKALETVRGAGDRGPGSGDRGPGSGGADAEPPLELREPVVTAPTTEPVQTDPGPRTPSSRAPVFDGLDGATADILLLDARGLVLAGGLVGPGGHDVSELAAAALAGVSGEAARTTEYLGLGAWGTIVAEADSATIVLAEVTDGALLLVRRDRSIPVGLALRFAERARGAAAAWLAGQGA
jgi:tetratricopeptide (TPR) repeat protein